MAKKDDIGPVPTPRADGEMNLPQPDDKQFRKLIEQVKDYAIFMLDPQGRIVSWNLGAELMGGYSPEDVIGKHFSIFYSEEERKAELPQRQLEVVKSVGSLDVQGWRRRKDGSRFWAFITITALTDDDGNIAGFAKITRDMSERRAIEEALDESRNMFERLFENSPDGIVVVDGSGAIRMVNQQTETIFGFLRDELLGQRIEFLVPERYRERHSQERSEYFRDPRARKMGIGLELYGRHKDGREIAVDIMLAPIVTNDGTWAFAVIRDITQQKQSDAKILELNCALRNQVEQLEASNRELEAFSYSVSHDLRAPLRHIIGFVDLLDGRSRAGLDEKSLHYLDVIAGAAKKMGNLIDDLLAFSRMGRTEMMRKRIDFGSVVNDIVRELVAEEKGREIEWVIGPLPEVVGDAAMLRQVMYNLLANAVKFTRERPAARIEVGAAEQQNETHFYVRDNGVGFDSAYIGKLYGLFQRLHRSEEFEGTGVGLAIVQRIIMRHGGRVWAEGAVGLGATFWFSLPKD
jgi:PAS domain S-box-containing protein